MICRALVVLAASAGCDEAFDLVAVPPPPDADGLPTESLIAHWTMDSVVGGLLSDSMMAHDGTCATASCPTPVPGRLGTALDFDGAGHFIDVPPSPPLETTAGFTATVWVNHAGTNSTPVCAISKPVGTIGHNSWQICVDGGDRVVIYVFDGGPREVYATTLTVGQWHHLAASWDGATLRGFVDGVAQVSLSTATIVFDGDGLVIGGDRDGGQPFALYPGAIDDVRLYGRALAPMEIDALATR